VVVSMFIWLESGSPGPLAQLAEQRTFNPRVPGSTPGRPTPVSVWFRLMRDIPSPVDV
jgi:hypothetical protein